MSVDQNLYDDIQRHIDSTSQADLGEITELAIRRYALAIGDPNPLYCDAKYAWSQGHANIVAPPNMLPSIIDWGVGQPEAELNVDGTTGEHLEGVNTAGVRIMGGGESMQFHRPVIAGCHITQTTTLTGATMRESRAGSMIVVQYRNDYRDEHGTALMTCDRTMLLR